MDGATLAEVMRQRGINMRYLGKVLDLVLRSPARDQLDHIYVSGACPGRWWQLEAWNLPETSFFDPPENRHWRAHHTLRQAYLQDIPTGAALFPNLLGPPWVAWGLEKSPGWRLRAILTSTKSLGSGSGALGPLSCHQPLPELFPELLPQPCGPPAC